MAESIVSDLIGRLLEFLGQSAAEMIAPYFGGRGKLDDLKLTMKMMQDRLYDAERRQEAEGGALIKEWLRQLKRTMYRLEDLLEEHAVADEQDEPEASGRLTKVVCYLPSKFSSLKMNRTLCLEAEDIMRDLERITSNMARFHFNELVVDQQRMNMINRREETISFIPEEEVIGRDEEKNEIRRMLLECDDVKKNLPVISIVGMGGLGKTALAQLVFNDKQVEQHFELKSWACIDQIPNFRELAGKVFHSVCRKPWQDYRTEDLQLELRHAVDGKRFLLVLDDVWHDNRDWWLDLEHLLRGGKQGSKILATTRTIAVASSMGTIQPYLLGNLSEDKSWELFKRVAFKDQLEEPNEDFISIGKEIIKKCGNVPLAIRTIAGHLYSRNTEYWMYFRDRKIGIIGQTDIMPTLKISYHHLQPEQKQCFAYCALFQKDHLFDVPMLIRLWMAQGFVKSLDEGRVCFMELLRRCFFQNLNVDVELEHAETCQMHDLMHDLAQMVGDECQLVDSPSKYVNDNIKHVRIVNNSRSVLRSGSLSNSPSHLRSYVEFEDFVGLLIVPKLDFDGNISSWRRLRVLFLEDKTYKSLPESVGELIHLRYLKVSVDAHYLPEGITKLRYLQSLDLVVSSELRELPREFYRLTSLKHLRLGADISLIDMPPRFGELTSLESLDIFIVGENNGLDALSGMNLAERLVIDFKKQRDGAVMEAAKANLKGKKLTALHLMFTYDSATEADELLEHLQPPSTLKLLRLDGWNGERFPPWEIRQLPNLVYLCIWNCKRCRNILPFSGLPHIKSLDVINCEELDLWGVKDEDGDAGKGNSVNSSTWPCMKSLERLHLSGVSKLQSLPSGIGGLTALQKLSIVDCDNLKTLPEWIGSLSQLRTLYLGGCSKLEALPKSIQNLTALETLEIRGCSILRTRCAEPVGDDWPLIQHIRLKVIR